MERLRGVPLTDLAAIRRVTDVDPESVLVNALNTWFGSVLACETFHADMCAPLPLLAAILLLPAAQYLPLGCQQVHSPVTPSSSGRIPQAMLEVLHLSWR